MLFHSPETLPFIILTLTNFSSVPDTVPDTSSILEIFTMVTEFIMPCGRISNGITQTVCGKTGSVHDSDWTVEIKESCKGEAVFHLSFEI